MNELTAGRKHARDFAQCRIRMIDVIARSEIDDHVKRCVVERKVAGVAHMKLRGNPTVRESRLRQGDQLGIDVQSGESRRAAELPERRQTHPSAASDLEHPASARDR